MKRNLICCVVWLLVMACAGLNRQDPPLWFFEQSKNTSCYYGYGSAPSDEEAKALALRDLGDQLRFSVQAYKQLSNWHRDDFSTHLPETVNLPEVKAEFVNVSKSARVRGVSYVRVEIPENVLLEDFRARYQWHAHALENAQENIKKLNQTSGACALSARERWRLRTQLKELEALESALEALDGFRDGVYRTHHDMLLSTHSLPPIRLMIDSDDPSLQKSIRQAIEVYYEIMPHAKSELAMVSVERHHGNLAEIRVAFELKDCQGQRLYYTILTGTTIDEISITFKERLRNFIEGEYKIREK